MPAPHSWMAWRKVLSCKRECTVAVHEPHSLSPSCTTQQKKKKKKKKIGAGHGHGAVALNEEEDEGKMNVSRKDRKERSSPGSSALSTSSCSSLKNTQVQYPNGSPLQLRALIQMQDTMISHIHDQAYSQSHAHSHGYGDSHCQVQCHGHSYSHSYGHSSVRCRSERVISHSSPSLAGHYDLLLQCPPSADALISAPHSGSMMYPHSGMLCTRCGQEMGSRAAFEEHHLTYHSVSELKEGDSARNIVEIIFQSSWPLRKQSPPIAMACKLEKIFKVHNSSQTVAEFEKYRDMVKKNSSSSSNGCGNGGSNKVSNSKRNSRCMADGNELLRFYGTTIACNLGKAWPSPSPSSPRLLLPPSFLSASSSSSSSALCTLPSCGVCHVLRHGFPQLGSGISTTSGSGKAHNAAAAAAILSRDASSSSCSSSCSSSYDEANGSNKHAMLICRVIAGRVKTYSHCDGIPTPPLDFSSSGSYDSYAAGEAGEFNLEELVVFNNTAVLPCFIVIYDTC